MRNVFLIALLLLVAIGEARERFANPVAEHGADPWVIHEEGRYYYCYSGRGAIWVAASDSLLKVFKSKAVEVWRPERGKPWSHGLWAPELHRIGGVWYVYVAADDGDNAQHRMQVLRRQEADPCGPFEHAGELNLAEDRWAIDGTALEHAGQLYHIWSGWEGTENVQQNLYISRMEDPVTPVGPRVKISQPEHDWELRGGNPRINEGPTALVNGEDTFVIYSASGSWSDHYCLGILKLVGGDPMDPASWVKSRKPWFEGSRRVIAPGHASFTVSPDGRENWIVYHVARHPGAGWDRQVQIQPFTFDRTHGAPEIGAPVRAGVKIPVPSGEP
ncbi:GH43 family beta-xylosidase [Haloferula luteola]|uniref:GH43 family beta-xylosidase n=1 Tax=Haloferula luteola TaxID=595692 RepID=A0A840V7U0_9BACT|nr:glycoside hydrolase family 43 protein [Haloferula luteola]MBB5351654.1 GH43 family beta-xylosidase [Haloferula luteola]